jgi:hypothetical protein
MAQVALNKFRTIRYNLTTSNVGIYTCPIGVSCIVVLAQVTNTSEGIGRSSYTVTSYHSRPSETPTDYKFAYKVPIPPNDSYNLVSDGRLVLETNDILKISSNENNVLNIVLSVLETAKQ